MKSKEPDSVNKQKHKHSEPSYWVVQESAIWKFIEKNDGWAKWFGGTYSNGATTKQRGDLRRSAKLKFLQSDASGEWHLKCDMPQYKLIDLGPPSQHKDSSIPLTPSTSTPKSIPTTSSPPSSMTSQRSTPPAHTVPQSITSHHCVLCFDSGDNGSNRKWVPPCFVCLDGWSNLLGNKDTQDETPTSRLEQLWRVWFALCRPGNDPKGKNWEAVQPQLKEMFNNESVSQQALAAEEVSDAANSNKIHGTTSSPRSNPTMACTSLCHLITHQNPCPTLRTLKKKKKTPTSSK